MRIVKAWMLAGCVFLTAGSVGCQLDRTSIGFDSDQRTPSLGLHLVPKRKDKPAERPVVPISSELAPREQPETASTPEKKRSRWPNWLGRLSREKRIPLPVDEAIPTTEPSADSDIAATDIDAF